MPIGCGPAFCASRQQSLDLSFQCNLFSRLDPFPFSSDLMSSHLISSHFISFHLSSSHLISCLVSFSRRFSANHISSHLMSSRLSSPLRFSELLSFQRFSASQPCLSSFYFIAAQLLERMFFFPVLVRHLIFRHLFSSVIAYLHFLTFQS